MRWPMPVLAKPLLDAGVPAGVARRVLSAGWTLAGGDDSWMSDPWEPARSEWVGAYALRADLRPANRPEGVTLLAGDAAALTEALKRNGGELAGLVAPAGAAGDLWLAEADESLRWPQVGVPANVTVWEPRPGSRLTDLETLNGRLFELRSALSDAPRPQI